MIIGCFALVQPFSPLKRQFELIREMGFNHADLTDNHDGATLGCEYGFSASISLESHPATIREMLQSTGLELTSVCAHANLLDPSSPDTYSTHEIIKAIRLANLLGVKQVITTEGEPRSDFGKRLTRDQKLLLIADRLHEPIRWAEEFGIEILLEPHGEITDSVEGMQAILDTLGHEKTIGINLDTGNSWLGGGDPLAFIDTFHTRIRHVHWKDMGNEWTERRGTIFGCGMGSIPLGDGVIGIRSIVDALCNIGFSGPTTLEVAGHENMCISAERLRAWST
jgi:inosose dehydratase